MAVTPQTTDTTMTTYARLAIFSVHPDNEEHLHHKQGTRDEAQSWLETSPPFTV